MDAASGQPDTDAMQALVATSVLHVPRHLRGTAEPATRPDTIVFGLGLPDPARHPVEALKQLLVEVLADTDSSTLSYEFRPCYPALARAIAAHHRAQDGVPLDASQIVATNGTSGALALLANTLIEPGDVVIAEELSYWGALRMFRMAGAEIETVPLDRQGLCVDALEALLARLRAQGRRVKFIYTIANCQSPTGSVLPEARRSALAALARREDLAIVQDDTYGEIRFEAFPANLLAFAPERTLHLGSFSKTLAPGLRLGWIAAPPGFAATLNRARGDLGTTPIVQHVVARLFERGLYREHVATLGEFYRNKRDLMLAALSEHCAPYCSWAVPAGGFFIWATLRSGDAARLLQFANEEGVGFYIGNDSSYAGNAPRSMRLAYGDLAPEEIAEGIRRLGRAMARLAGQAAKSGALAAAD